MPKNRRASSKRKPRRAAPRAATMINVQIIIPSGRGLWPIEFCLSLLSNIMTVKQVAPDDVSVDVEVTQGSTLQLSRTTLVRKALKNGADFVLFLDDDHIFPADTIIWLLKRFNDNPDKDIICANYARRTIPSGPVSRDLDGKLLYTRPNDKGLQAVRYSGLGVAMIRASVLRSVPEPWFDFEWDYDTEKDEWFIGRSEDVVFFDKLRDFGHTVYLDHDLSQHVEHIGVFGYRNEHAIPQDEQITILGKQLEQQL